MWQIANQMNLLRGFLDLLYPPCCVGCAGRPERPSLPLCPACLRRMEQAPQMNVAARLDRLPPDWGTASGAHAMWVFDKGGALQSIQHALKYGDRPQYGVELGRLLGQSYRRAGWPEPDRVVPIPLHRLRLLERGYNQAETLARGVASTLSTRLDPHTLTRHRATRSQTNLSRDERWRNVCDAFSVAESIDGGTLLLVDDVLTTGSTAMACARTLKAAGADRVLITTLCLARA
ncbi:amidophosphoribosyltransferase [Longibacter salinarum]|uniref:Amidophosphoribosyltransferase n=1 Tax=Longibacter salinarum TaxID=1850348 RepID=A0A2A8D146_9BACT|nr:ComF family protein [Longibacter salinarum]PEN14614.1 amidophosphoribosyltransferase [Longibacter salinarum]